MSALIDAQRDANSPPVMDPIELEYERDAQLDPSIVLPADPGVATADMQRVLLTGGTGFLGAFLLQELLQRTERRRLLPGSLFQLGARSGEDSTEPCPVRFGPGRCGRTR